MKYKKENNKKISFGSIIQLAILFSGLAIAVFLTDQTQKHIGRASSSPKPSEVKITNITSSSFTVSFRTDRPSATAVILKDLGTEKIFFDDRLSTYTSNSLFYLHHITVKNLTPSKSYSFLIQSGKERFNNQGKDYQVTLLPFLETNPPSSFFLYGSLLDKNNQPINGALVYLEGENFSPLSFLTNKDGAFVFSLNSSLFTPEKSLNLIAKTDKNEIVSQEIFLTGKDQNLGSIVINQ